MDDHADLPQMSADVSLTPNGLALEYQRDYGSARGNLDVFDLVNNPAANGVCSVFGLGFEEQLSNRFFIEFRALLNNRTNPVVLDIDQI